MKRVTGIAIFMLAGMVWAQNDNELTPREAFWIKAPAAPAVTHKSSADGKPKSIDALQGKPPVVPPPVGAASANDKDPGVPPLILRTAYVPLALRYSIQQKKGNAFEDVDADTEFHSGDRIRVNVEANATSYLYIVMNGSSGQWRVLFPSNEIDGGNNRIENGQRRTIPFYFDETAGIEKLSLVLSRTPEPDLEKLIYAAGDPSRTDDQRKQMIAQNRPVDNSVMGRVRNSLVSRDLVFEKSDHAPDGGQEKAVYAATRDKSQDARLFVDLKLIHK